MAVAAMQGADQHIGISGVHYLAQGHLNMQTGGIEQATFWTGRCLYPWATAATFICNTLYKMSIDLVCSVK